MNTHQKYKTINHIHFVFNYKVLDKEYEYPDAELMLVECGDGRWFIEQSSGEKYNQFPSITHSSEDVETQPTFYPDVATAARAAFALTKQVYPTTPDEFLHDFLCEVD